MPHKERGLIELYNDDPERAEYLVFGRKAGPDRRGFLRGAGLASMGAVLGTTIPFSANMPAGLMPLRWPKPSTNSASIPNMPI